MDIDKLINSLQKKDDNQISRIFNNAIDIISNNKPQKEDAIKTINAIKIEWKRRLELFKLGKYKTTSPNLGMLGFLGYHVGHQGEPKKRRRYLIDWIMSNDLPLVQSPTYLLEWNKPKSLERYKKFHRVLQGLITSNENRKDIEYRDFDKAIMEWKDDLEYLENKWMNKSI